MLQLEVAVVFWIAVDLFSSVVHPKYRGILNHRSTSLLEEEMNI